jgi:hypothetical protein
MNLNEKLISNEIRGIKRKVVLEVFSRKMDDKLFEKRKF